MSSCNEHNSRVFIPHSLKQGYLKRSQWMNFFDISRNWRPRLHCHMWKVISEIHCQRFVMSHACTRSRLRHPRFLSPFLPSIVLRIRFASKLTLKWQRNTTDLFIPIMHSLFSSFVFFKNYFFHCCSYPPGRLPRDPLTHPRCTLLPFPYSGFQQKTLFSRVVAFKNKTSRSYTECHQVLRMVLKVSGCCRTPIGDLYRR